MKEQMKMQHNLKILPQYFKQVEYGLKTFELRKNDRDFQIGDIVRLKEWDKEKYTGNELNLEITYIIKNKPNYGLMEGYCIFSFQILKD